MKFSETWLREWVNPAVDTAALLEQLTMAGLEVDGMEAAADEFTKVVVGKVVAAEQHPDAERLKVCQVDVGSGSDLQIVCGGVNVRADILVPVAIVGAKLGADFKIKKAKLRGVESQGMICAATELGLAEDDGSHGIMELALDAPIGTDFREYLALNDNIIEIDLTPNRGDCASIRGVAREVAASNRVAFTEPAVNTVSPRIDDVFKVKVKNSEACPRYCGRVLRGINPNASTPIWMQERLRRSGVRSLHPAVDVTNYVMMELGQPMHAFDLNKLHGGIEVRFAKAGEKVTLLDDTELELNKNQLVIADHEAPVALAGVMGGADSAVSDQTTDLFLESAFFEPELISVTARGVDKQTDSSYRFARGVDFLLQERALERATELLQSIVGGEAGPVTEVVCEKDLPQRLPIQLRYKRIEQLLGVTVDPSKATQFIESLGMHYSVNEQGWLVTPPSFRFDIEQEADLIEEIARCYGYQNIPVELGKTSVATKNTKPPVLHAMRDSLVARGYREIMSYSFVSSELQQQFDPEAAAVSLANPLAQDMSTMRSSLWPGLVSTCAYNLNRQQTNQRLFESGMCFAEGKKAFDQRDKLSGLITGERWPLAWNGKREQLDFYDLKADVDAMLQCTGLELSWKAETHPALHPGQSAGLYYQEQCVGQAGAMHPELLQQLGIEQAVFVFEVDLSLLPVAELAQFRAISKYPPVRRDLAFIVDESLPVAAILGKIREKLIRCLNSVQIFDIYQGQGIELGKKSVALGLILQDAERTLTDAEINEMMDDVVQSLAESFNATLRG